MKIRTFVGSASALASLASLPACNGQLAVADAIDTQDTNLTGGDLSTDGASSAVSSAAVFEPHGPLNADCPCATTSGLQPLLCNGQEVALLENDIVQTTQDGSVVAFSVGYPDHQEVAYWRGSDTTAVASGMLLGLSASGQRLLSAVEQGSLLVEPGGNSRVLALYNMVGHGALSASGDWAFGAVYEQGTGKLERANANTGSVELLGNIGEIARAYVTPDASTVVGWAIRASGGFDAFRWTRGDGLSFELPNAPSGSLWPEAVSANGAVIAGRSPTGHFRWSEADGFESIVPASGRSETFLSADGDVVLGSLDPAGANESAAFRWTRETGAVDLTPGHASIALGMSDDGRVILANSWEEAQLDGAAPSATYVWDEAAGARTLAAILVERGVDTTGWEFGHARKLSGNGKVLLGRGSCGGVPTLYRAVLSD